jgi:hypothetical protein
VLYHACGALRNTSVQCMTAMRDVSKAEARVSTCSTH